MLIIGQKIIDLTSVETDILPDATGNQRKLGNFFNQFEETHTQKIFASAGDGYFGVAEPGGFAGGFADADSNIQSSGKGSFAQGSSTGNSTIYALAYASFAQGHAYHYSEIVAAGYGAFAQGYAYYSSKIQSYNNGSFAQGTAKGYGNYGYYYYPKIASYNKGSFAQGYARWNDIKSYGNGSFAQGHANSSSIIALHDNSVQFGPGTNVEPDSLKVGSSGLRLKGTYGPASPVVNGDIWVDNNHVYIQSDGQARNISSVSSMPL